MKLRKVVIVIALIVVAVVVISKVWTGYSNWQKGRVLVAKGRDLLNPRWSRDGKYLYYVSGDPQSVLYRYEVATGERRLLYRVPNGYAAGDRIMMCADETLVFDTNGRLIKKLPFTVYQGEISTDGSGLAYQEASPERLYYYDFINSTNKHINTHTLSTPNISFFIVYASKHQIIYTYGDCKQVEAVNIDTMRVTSFPLPDVRPDMRFSPDMSKYWILDEPYGDMTPFPTDKLYLYKTPPAAMKKLQDNLKNRSNN